MLFKSYLNISVNTIKSSGKSMTNAVDETIPNLDIYSTLLSYVEINEIDDIIPSFTLNQALGFISSFFDSKLRLLNTKWQVSYFDMPRHMVYFLEQEWGYSDEVYRFGEMMLKSIK